jgi:hypothetical protein
MVNQIIGASMPYPEHRVISGYQTGPWNTHVTTFRGRLHLAETLSTWDTSNWSQNLIVTDERICGACNVQLYELLRCTQ